MKVKIATVILILTVVALISGVTMLALAAPGSQENPFITLNYLNDNFKPRMIDEARAIEAELMQAFDTKIEDLEARLERAYGDVSTIPDNTAGFTVVTLRSGQSLVCSVGVEIMLRTGSAIGFGAGPALVNYTNGETLSDGASLTANNMYLVTIEGNGIRATSDSTRVLARGNYVVN